LLDFSLLKVMIYVQKARTWISKLSEQDCVRKSKNLLPSKTQNNALCYDTIKCRNLMSEVLRTEAETSIPKCRDFVLLKMMQCTKAEMFIHVPETFIHAAVQNLTMRLTYTELRITAGQ